jgi:hypothetical protein
MFPDPNTWRGRHNGQGRRRADACEPRLINAFWCPRIKQQCSRSKTLRYTYCIGQQKDDSLNPKVVSLWPHCGRLRRAKSSKSVRESRFPALT